MAEDQVKGAEALRKGDWDMAFISPERLVLWMRSGFWTKISSQVSLLTFDEAHCLVEWRGFRPLFQELEERIAVAGINLPPLLLLSATLSPESLEDLARRWRREFRGVRAQVGRENLYLAVESFSEEKHRWLRLAGHLRNLESPKAAIVYCGTRREAELVAAFLQSGGLGAVAYHAGLAPQRRRRLEDAFRLGRLRVVCATSAFGLGIDYPFVERVIHWGPPDDISSYWQEAGRAGRSGSPAYCFLLWLRSDFFLWRDRIRKAAQNEVKTKWKNFKRMAAFLRTNQCRKAWVASELGWSSPACGNCDQCHRNQAQSSHLPWSYIDEKENLAWWLAPELELIYRDWPESRWVMDSSVEWEQEYCQELSDKSLD
jgi:ATP-dependent DNA helicase RecQ